jgi:hypothetical protein
MNWRPALLSATTTDSSSPMFISRMSRGRSAAKLLTKDEGQVAVNIALNGTSMGQTALMAATETSS